ncbi:fasciclin domain-containing protein [Seonamhaeicola aphaedonensis]|uniref:Putative surface protein with fasciclin (FAS1) repeats n=1 Tax=Seonamhaeicola aphaedonensis TaxID=1461338 RepID=A0A3D9HJC3_9FLAO|nr:fasciclin domain-containing protein [Seonamhaeicola aphaedonensis]RED49535.1 putative surface protein with fasciclin (FAS1) repeats [Seonamhaeicola aphaedonensis]
MKTALTVNRLPKIYLFFLPILLFLFTIFSCSNEEVDTIDLNSGLPDLVEVLESYGSGQDITAKATESKDGDYEPTFDVLSKALARTKLASTVSRNRLTVFAPTDDAFAALGITTKNVTEVDNLADILLYHVVWATVYSNQLENGSVPTANGAEVIINIDNGVLVNNARVTMADIKARNGVIHVIDSVLFPPSMTTAEIASSNPDFSVLLAAAVHANLASALGDSMPETVFAPTNQAFVDFLGVADSDAAITTIESLDPMLVASILKYHIVGGYVFSNQLSNGFVPTANGAAVEVDLSMGVMINDANVVMPNVQSTNGVIHVIDKVLSPPTMNLVEKAASFAPEFSILLAAATKAGLAGVLMGEGPYEQLTVFAPTNQAFMDLLNNLPDYDSLDDFDTEEDIALLTSILLYHVVEGRVYSSDLTSGPVTTLNGAFNLDLDNLTLDGNAMLDPSLLNVQATNGVIHVIDAVLVP